MFLVLALIAATALAGDYAANVSTLSSLIDDLEARVAGDRGFVDDAEAERRFGDALYAYMTDDYLAAAESFFLLSRVVTDPGLRGDSQWYLADSLYQLGTLDLAEETLLAIDGDPSNPFRVDAAHRLLDLYASSRRGEDFLRYYARSVDHIPTGDRLTYTLGKSFYLLGELERAHEILEDIPRESAHYTRARYVLGAIHVIDGNLEEAATHFKDNLSMSIDDHADRQVSDLTVIALARLAFDRGDYVEATEYYGRIGGDSDYVPEQLFEQMWAFVRLEDDLRALESLELFLLRFPDHPNAGRLRLARGHLQMRQGKWADATAEYEQVIEDYRPLQGAAYEDLPIWFQEQIAAEPDFAAAQTIVTSLQQQRDQLQLSEQMIAELTDTLAEEPVLRRHHEMYIDTAMGLKISLVLAMNVLSVDARTLPSNRKEGRSKLADLRTRRGELIRRLKAIEAHEKLPVAEARAANTNLLQLRDDVIGQWTAQRAYRRASGKTRDDDKAEEVIETLTTLTERLHRTFEVVQTQSARAVDPLRKTLALESLAVRDAGIEQAALTAVGEAVLRDAEADGVISLDGFVTGAIRQADMGLADAAWSELLDTVEEKEEIMIERNEKLKLLASTMDGMRNRGR